MPSTAVNAFRIIADLSHTVSKCILIFAIHSNRSAEGVSLITQILYALVFCSRYLDLFWSHPFSYWGKQDTDHVFLGIWNFFLKIFYILSSLWIIFVMLKVYGRTHERERAWRLGYACLGVSLALAPIVMAIWDYWHGFGGWVVLYLWTFSQILESICVLPQLLLLRQTSVPTVIDSFYLLTLGSYRFFYVLNWIVRGANHDPYLETTSVVFGVIQTLFYVDFAWVYWTRQRVKLRNGAVVDGEDIRKGWMLDWVFGKAGVSNAGDGEYDGTADAGRLGRQRAAEEGEADDGAQRSRTVGSNGGWGKRGISVSADEDIPKPKSGGRAEEGGASNGERDAMLGDDGDEWDDYADDAPAEVVHPGGVHGGGSEWR